MRSDAVHRCEEKAQRWIARCPNTCNFWGNHVLQQKLDEWQGFHVSNASECLASLVSKCFYDMWYSSKFGFAKNLEAQRRKIDKDSVTLWQWPCLGHSDVLCLPWQQLRVWGSGLSIQPRIAVAHHTQNRNLFKTPAWHGEVQVTMWHIPATALMQFRTGIQMKLAQLTVITTLLPPLMLVFARILWRALVKLEHLLSRASTVIAPVQPRCPTIPLWSNALLQVH